MKRSAVKTMSFTKSIFKAANPGSSTAVAVGRAGTINVNTKRDDRRKKQVFYQMAKMLYAFNKTLLVHPV